MNIKAIADAIAGRFTGVTAIVGGSTQGIIVGPTASLPNAIAKGPALIVYHPTGVLEVAMSRRRQDVYEFPVRLLTDPLNYPQRSDALYAWADALRDRIEMDMDLGLAYVAWARPVAMQIELDGWQYGDSTFDMVELTVAVRIDEVVTTLAI